MHAVFRTYNIQHNMANIHSLIITIHDAFDIADPSSTQDACHT